MSEGMSDAERIRQKRIAKLSAAPPVSQTETSTVATSETPSRNPTPKTTSQTDGAADANPFTQLGLMKSQEQPKPAINITPSQTTPQKRDASDTPRPRSALSSQRETPEEWEHKTLSSVFKITLDSAKTKDAHGNQLQYLEGLRAELEADNAPLLLVTALLDQALVEAAQSPKTKPLDYLLACWKRIARFTRMLKPGQEDGKIAVMREAKRMCMSYCIFAVTIPDMFGHEPTPVSPLVQHLLVDPENDRGICHDFLTEAVSRFEEDESAKTMLVEAVEQLSQQLAAISIDGNYRPYVMALVHLVRYTPLVNALAESPKFLAPQAEARNIESDTLLGPFFKLSPLDPEVAYRYFASQTNDGATRTAQNALRLSLTQHQSVLFDIADRFIKSSKESREKILDWFAMIINSNHRRRAYHTEPKLVSSDGFMVNVTVCLDRLCEPFMDATFSKVNRIEPDYFKRSPRVNIQDDTKINADQKTADAFYGQEAQGSSNFISEVFFLTVAAHHYGIGATISKQTDVGRQQRHTERQLAGFEAQRNNYLNNSAALTIFDQRLATVKKQIEMTRCTVVATEGILMDEIMQGRAMGLMRYVIVWLCRLVSHVEFPKQAMNMPLPEEQPDVFRCLPEYFVENIVDHFKYITRNMPHIISSTQCDEIVMFCIAFLRSSDYIKNPGLKSGFIAILFHGVWPVRNFPRGILGDILNSLPFSNQHLLHALMNFYIECERTGAHGQFYDKFNIRYEIFQVIKCVWGNTVYREQLSKESKVNVEFFVQFVNMLLNDVTFVLDESLTGLTQIHDITKELRDQVAGMTEEEKQQKEEALEAAKGKAKSYMQLTTESLAMLKLFTDALADAFTMPEIVQRLADMLDYNLDSLTGSKSNNLKVENAQHDYKFDPVSLLGDIMSVYLNLSTKPSFHQAVARDGRSYKPANLDRAAAIMARKAAKSSQELARWKKLCENIAAAKEEEEAEEEDLGEIPDEYMDPIMGTLMKDPVTLPTSKNIVDRSTIRQVLLSDPLDPFNRAPLKIEDVVSNDELRIEIQAWIAEKKGKKGVVAGDDAMDLS